MFLNWGRMVRHVLKILTLWIHAIYKKRLNHAPSWRYGWRIKGKSRDIKKSGLKKAGIRLRGLGIETYPTETYFFLGKLPTDADEFARKLRERNIHVRPLH